MKYLVANWKAQMVLSEAAEWTTIFKNLLDQSKTLTDALRENRLTVCVCPPSPFILFVKDRFEGIPNLTVGAQNISPVQTGKYTGEVTAEAIKDICEYSIVGHSERRVAFGESEQEIDSKISFCHRFNIKSILCVRSELDTLYEYARLIAYEPVEAVGTGKNADVQSVLQMKSKLAIPATKPFLYGGSVDQSNCESYLETKQIDGFLVGTASLDARSFYSICEKTVERI